MSQEVEQLEAQRSELLKQLCELDDFRPGSITPMTRRCGKPSCHCANSDDPGHGPTMRLTYKIAGKSRSEALSSPNAVKKVEAEIAEYRRFQELTRRLVEVNWNICRLRDAQQDQQSEAQRKKNVKKRSSKKSGKK